MKKFLEKYYIYIYCFICFFMVGILMFLHDLFTAHTYGLFITIPFLILSIICIFCSRIKLISLFSITYFLCFILHFGQLIVLGIFKEYQMSLNVWNELSSSVALPSYCYSLFFFMILLLFGMIFYDRSCVETRIKNIDFASNTCLKKITFFILFTAFPLQLFFWGKAIYLRFISNYLQMLESANNGFLEMFAKFHILAIIGLFLVYKENTKIRRMILVVYSIIVVGSMLSGGRMYAISLLVTVVLFYLRINEVNFNFKQIAVCIICLILLLNVLNFIAKSRNNDINTYDGDEYSSIMTSESTKNNAIMDFLCEMGSTQMTVGLIQNRIEEGKINFSLGKSYILSFINILPNINGIVSKISEDNNYVILIDYPALGGSIIGESYYNFGWFGLLFAILFSYVLYKIEWLISWSLKEKKIVMTLYSSIIVYALILWQRNTFSVTTRYTFYTFFLLLFLYVIFNHKKISFQNEKSL